MALEANSQMLRDLLSLDCSLRSLSPSLLKLVQGGFIVRDGCCVLTAFQNAIQESDFSLFKDKTGYEYAANSFHIEDYADCEFLCQAILFLEAIFECWLGTNSEERLVCIVIGNDGDIQIRLHLDRAGERILSANLESYAGPALIVNSAQYFEGQLREILPNSAT